MGRQKAINDPVQISLIIDKKEKEQLDKLSKEINCSRSEIIRDTCRLVLYSKERYKMTEEKYNKMVDILKPIYKKYKWDFKKEEVINLIKSVISKYNYIYFPENIEEKYGDVKISIFLDDNTRIFVNPQGITIEEINIMRDVIIMEKEHNALIKKPIR